MPTKEDQTQFPSVGRTDFCGDYESDKGEATTLTPEMSAAFAALVEDKGYETTGRIIAEAYPKAASAWAEFRRQNEKKGDGL